MNKSIIITTIFLFARFLNAQVTVFDSKELLKKINGKTLNIATNDTILRKLYTVVFKNNEEFSSITFMNEEDFFKSIELDMWYLTVSKVKKLNDKGELMYAFEYLTLFEANKSTLNVIKKDKDLNFSTIKSSVLFPLEKKKINDVERYNFGVLKNNLQQIKSTCEKGKDIMYYRDFSNNEKLSKLKEDTLYVVQDDSNNPSLRNLFSKNYPYKYSFISNSTLENYILHSKKEFYYMHFAYSTELWQNQIGVVNSLTGEEIFHNKILTRDLQISERILENFISEIKKNKK